MINNERRGRPRGGRWLAATALALVGLLAMASSAAAASASAGSSAPPETTIAGVPWYQVSTPAELEYIDQNQSGYLNANIELMGDISLSGYAWTPFGSAATCYSSSSSGFSGTFNGNGYSITGLNVADATDECVGFFGETTGTIEKLTVSGSVAGTSSAGPFVGGLVGEQSNGTIDDSGAAVDDTAGDAGPIGGLVGSQVAGTIEGSYASGTVTSTQSQDEGGLIGAADGTIEDSYATGVVRTGTGYDYVGGLVGYLGGVIEDSYSTGAATIGGSAASTGGLVGLDYGGTISGAFFLLSEPDERGAGGDSSPPGAILGETSASALTAAAHSAGWNFATIWGTSASLNGGFPYLQWQFPPTPTPSTPPPPTLTTGSVPVGSGTQSVIENMGYNSPDAIANGTSAGYVEERTALQAGVTFGGEGTDSSYLSDILSGTGVDLADPNVSPGQQGMFAALYQKLGIIPTWTDNTVSIGAGVAALEKAKASDLAMENYLVQLDGFTWAAAEAEAAAGFPIGQAT